MADWRRHAACAGMDPELFFPLDRGMTPQAHAACSGCVVRGECLDSASAEGFDGTWGIRGGLSEATRAALMRLADRELASA